MYLPDSFSISKVISIDVLLLYNIAFVAGGPMLQIKNNRIKLRGIVKN